MVVDLSGAVVAEVLVEDAVIAANGLVVLRQGVLEVIQAVVDIAISLYTVAFAV